MLRDSHRALMHTDAALRSELKDCIKGIGPMPSTGRRTFETCSSTTKVSASAPPPDTANVNLWPRRMRDTMTMNRKTARSSSNGPRQLLGANV